MVNPAMRDIEIARSYLPSVAYLCPFTPFYVSLNSLDAFMLENMLSVRLCDHRLGAEMGIRYTIFLFISN